MKFRSFEESREYAHFLPEKYKSYNGWRALSKLKKRPKDIPSAPNVMYKDKGWISWSDWFGTNNIDYRIRIFRPFKDAREYARSLHLKSCKEWASHTQSIDFPTDIPKSPIWSYKNRNGNEWEGKGMNDFLGIIDERYNFLSFEEAKKFVRSLKLEGVQPWRTYCATGEKPKNIPSNPNVAYRNKGWTDWYDWLGME